MIYEALIRYSDESDEDEGMVVIISDTDDYVEDSEIFYYGLSIERAREFSQKRTIIDDLFIILSV